MKIKDIYNLAVGIMSKNNIEANEEEYRERTPYLAAIFCCNTAKIDRDLRESHGLPNQNHFNEVCLKMDEDFPLDSRFASLAAHYLASMLVMDYNDSISEKLFDIFINDMSKVLSEIPAKKQKIINVYPY